MATITVRVPSVGESVTEGILSRWLKEDGAAVTRGEPLFELETDKASQEIPAEVSGALKRQVQEGETVTVGQVVATLDTEAVGTPTTPSSTSKPKAAEAPPAAAAGPPAPPKRPPVEQAAVPAPHLSPAVRRVVEQEGVAAEEVKPSGPGGRITKGDVLDYVQERASSETARTTSDHAPSAAPASVSSPASASTPGRETRKRMSGIRQKIAQRLVEAQRTAAILTTFNEADLSAVMDYRARYKEAFQKKHGVGLGFMSFFVKASIEALKAFPNVNGRIEGNEIVTCHHYDIGVAVSTERGLMVPVLRDADSLSFAQIEAAIAAFAQKARENAISVDDLQGGTFTITNGGIFGSLLSTPILNPPQSGILGMHKIQERPVVVSGQIVARPMMYMALSYDHRLVDGREAVSFLVRIKDCIENPERMMLQV